MASTSTLIRPDLPILSSPTRRVDWPRKLIAVCMALIGVGFIATTLVANLVSVGPAFDRMTDGFRPILTQQAIQTARQDIANLGKAGTEFRTTLTPALATQLKVSPTQLMLSVATQYPAVAAGVSALPTVVPQFNALVTTLDQQRPLFRSADAIPTKDLPATTLPWSLLGVGVVAIGLGAFTWFAPRRGAVAAVAIGAIVTAGVFAMSMPGKASAADKMNANLKPVYTQELVTQANGALHTLSAMGTQMQTQMLPALVTQLHMQPAQLQAYLASNFPATAATLSSMPATMGRFHTLVATFQNHLSDYKTLKPVSLNPIVWTTVGLSLAFMLLGTALLLPWPRRSLTR